MPKFLPKKKKKSAEKKASKAKAKASPLMADEPKSSASSSSSRLKKDEERASERREREEKRKARDKRFKEAKESSSSSKSKKKSKPKLSREEQDAKDAQLGCWHKTQQILVKIVHVIDALIGLTFVVYGSLINNFENPAMDAVIMTLAFGSTMLFTSIMGVIGFYSKMCSRCGLVLSAYTAPFIAFFYLLVIIVLLSSPDMVFDYLTKYKDVMYLDDAEIAILKQILPFFYIVLASLAAIEIIRFLVMRNLRATLLRYDAASQRIFDSISSKKSDRSSSKKSSSKRSSKRSDTELTDPLMGDEEEGKVEEDDY